MTLVKIVDVTPRDGLQDATGYVPVADKVALARDLFHAGIHAVEVASFVHPRWVPLLADGEAVLSQLQDLPGEWIALAPNLKGVERAMAAGANTVTLVVSASESHNKANLNRSRDETLSQLTEATRRAHEAGLKVRGAISTAFECPFEGVVPINSVAFIAERYCDMGVDELGIADTLGTATPIQVKQRVCVVQSIAPKIPLALHLHDRLGWGLANVAMAYEHGVRIFESALAGLGGCPYAPGAAGNLDTEKLVTFFQAQGLATHIDVSQLPWIRQRLLNVIAQQLAPPN
ncbi:hydroxymethylglutaryl-CoA lyase [Sulfobacillus thermosulfidooxidans]|uniref:hydroxymethylglutaryl-CoA lyase n=1 Tax=Sulfobacillus thermosulfidooxidans TaxID=28034 RepID=UPI00096BA8F5|nr:hydroxymethylglutaryl-CoA lyase [Sulfobacillus thermosulfidooxidans]OLZ09031.1 hydroxymethylglutaryl-CoA lyase [Sulfobacillus thermosulfidooxidans]OLZ15215.1 hydroxymethylglutaryl-CoA lyase [Sulfobacillus thermosulfidooxidans]OLZ22204.1 hydroxymethylglutaryl-CoA lyase [Sulfobacillus thermosulfidooxidans]